MVVAALVVMSCLCDGLALDILDEYKLKSSMMMRLAIVNKRSGG